MAKKADAALSLYVRELTSRMYGGKCPLCGVGEIQCCFHFIRRKRKILRWCFENVVGACHRCNYIEYRDPDLSRAWFIRKHGVELYLSLVDMSKEAFEPTLDYLQGVAADFTARLAALNEPTVRPQITPDVPLNPDNMKGAGEEFGGEDFPSSQ